MIDPKNKNTLKSFSLCIGIVFILLVSITAIDWFRLYRASNIYAENFHTNIESTIVANIATMLNSLPNEHDAHRIDQFLRPYTERDYVYYIDVFSKENKLIARSVNRTLPIEMGIPITITKIPLNTASNTLSRFEIATTSYESNSIKNNLMLRVGIENAVFVLSLVAGLYIIISRYKISRNAEFVKIGIRSTAYKNKVLKTITHELSQPLNVIYPMLQLLVSHPKDFDRRNYENLRICAAASVRLKETLDQADVLYQSITKTPPVQKNKICMDDLIEVICLANHPQSDNIHFEKSVHNSKLIIELDQFRLKSIINNVLNNAVKFTKYGIINIEWQLEEKTNETTSLVIKIKDTGCGILKNNLEDIYTPFFKENDKSPGLGIGLTIAKNFTADLNGNIQVRSQPNKGTIVEITIPDIIEVSNEEEPVGIASYKGIKALIVDDIRSNSSKLESTLNSYHVECSVYTDPYEAIEEIYENDYQIVFINDWIPPMSGLELSRKIANLAVNIVCLTSNLEADLISRLEDEPHINQYLLKPLSNKSIENILKAINESKHVVDTVISSVNHSEKRVLGKSR